MNTEKGLFFPEPEALALANFIAYPHEFLERFEASGLKPEDFSELSRTVFESIRIEFMKAQGGICYEALATRTAESLAGRAEGLPEAVYEIAERAGASSVDALWAVDNLADSIAERKGVSLLTVCAERLKRSQDKRGEIGRIAGEVSKLAEGQATGKERTSQDIDEEAAGELLAIARGEREAQGLPLPLFGLDRKLEGLGAGLHILGARSSMGKSVLEGQIARYLEARGLGVVRVQLDQDMKSITQRDFVALSGFTLRELKQAGEELQAHLRLVSDAKKRLPQIVITDSDIDGIFRKIQWLIISGNAPALVTVDYVGAVQDNCHRAQSETDRIGHILERFRAFSRAHDDIAFLLLAQLNRESEKEAREPRLSDLAQSANIENRADTVVFIGPNFQGARELNSWKENEWNDGEFREMNPRPCNLTIAKSRQGGRASIPVALRGEWFTFEEPLRDETGAIDWASSSARVDGLDGQRRGRWILASNGSLEARFFCREWLDRVNEEARAQGLPEYRQTGYTNGIEADR